MSRNLLWIGMLAVALGACGDENEDGSKQAEEPSGEATEPDEGGQTDPAAQEPEDDPIAEVIEVKDVGFKTPESVLHDTSSDIYLVSNINGSPLEKDGNGFISKLSPDGEVTELEWIDGAADGVTLNAPKGMALWNGTLYVTDIDVVRMFDADSGAPKGEIAVEGATFMNDLAVGDDVMYASDSGMKAGADGFEPSGTDAIYTIDADGELSKLAEGEELNGPNGVAPAPEGVWVVTFRSNELYRIVDGKKVDVVTLPKGSLDGIAPRDDGTVLVSSWEGQAIYQGRPDGSFEAVIEGVQSPADIGIDADRDRVLIPVFQGNVVEIRPL